LLIEGINVFLPIGSNAGRCLGLIPLFIIVLEIFGLINLVATAGAEAGTIVCHGYYFFAGAIIKLYAASPVKQPLRRFSRAPMNIFLFY